MHVRVHLCIYMHRGASVRWRSGSRDLSSHELGDYLIINYDFLSDYTVIGQRVSSTFARDWPDILHFQNR